MTSSKIDTNAIEAHVQYLYSQPIEEIRELRNKITTGAYSKMLNYVYLDRTLPEKDDRNQIKV